MRSRATAAISAAALTLLLASTAFAGGWANAIMDAPPDDPGGPNQPITIGFTLLQHNVTPVDWGNAQIVLTNGVTGEAVTFDAQPQGAVGHWVAEISVPANGTWTYTVRHDLDIGMTGFNPITVGGTATAGSAASGLVLQPALLMIGGFLAVLIMVGATAGILAYRHTRLDRARA